MEASEKICGEQSNLDPEKQKELQKKSRPYSRNNPPRKAKKDVIIDVSRRFPELLSPGLKVKSRPLPKFKIGSPKNPWMKHSPSPCSASPLVTCLKRTAADLNSSIEDSPVLDNKRPRRRRVHFNKNPVSDCVEIPPRVCQDDKVVSRKLEMSVNTWEMSHNNGDLAPDNKEEEEELDTKFEVKQDCLFPELANCQEPIASLLHLLTSRLGRRELEKDLRSRKITSVGHLAGLDSTQVKLLKGIKTPADVTVRNVLSGFCDNLRTKYSLPTTSVRMVAPVIDVAVTEEEEERHFATLFADISPTTTEGGREDTASSEKGLKNAASDQMFLRQSSHGSCMKFPENEGMKLLETGIVKKTEVESSKMDLAMDVCRNKDKILDSTEWKNKTNLLKIAEPKEWEQISKDIKGDMDEVTKIPVSTVKYDNSSHDQGVTSVKPVSCSSPLDHLIQFLSSPLPSLRNCTISDFHTLSKTLARLTDIQTRLVNKLEQEKV